MQEQGAHEERVTGAHSAGDAALRRLNGLNLLSGEASVKMRGGDDAHGAIVVGTRVKVKTYGEHLFQDGGGGLDVLDAVFDGPGAEAGKVELTVDGDGEVLVPRHFPVGARSFVEQNGARDEGPRSKNRLD